MAFIQNNQNDEEKDKEGQPGQTSGDSGIISAGSAAGPNQPSNKPQSFATLQSYLKVNKPQGEQLATQVGQNLANTGNAARENLEKTANDLGSSISAQKVPYDANVVKEAVDKPTDFVKDENKVAQFNQFKNASYTGPKSAEAAPEFQQATNQVNSALAKNKLADSEAGRKELVADTQQNKATGITALNQALISTNPNAAATIQSNRTPFAGLQEMLGAKATDLNAKIADTSSTNSQAAADAQGMTLDKFNAVKKALEDKVTSTNADVRAKSAAIYSKLIKGQPLTDEEYLEIGASGQNDKSLNDDAKYYKGLYGLDMNKMQYVTDKGVSNNLNKEALASKEDYETEAALQKLLGNEFDFLPDDASKAGTADTRAGYSYDQGSYWKDMTEKANAMRDNFLKEYSPQIGSSLPMTDPKNQIAAEIYASNFDQLSPSQQEWYNLYVKNTGFKPQRPSQSIKAPVDPRTPPAPGESNTRVIPDANGQGQQMWYQNGQWIPAPPEYRNMQNGGYTEKFNYQTGKYEPTGWTGGTTDDLGNKPVGPGVFTSGGANYRDPKTGEVKRVY